MSGAVTSARAPGKLFLTGEWAVLSGAPALVAAVDRLAVVRLETDGDPGEMEIESLAEQRTVRLDAGGPHGGDAAAAGAVCRAVGVTGGRLIVDSREFLIGERKLGLGRSAATIVAVTAALLGRDGPCPRSRILAAALEANSILQDGLGSGADVAACVHGGVIEARRAADGVTIAPRTLPAGLHVVAGWTGDTAPTTPLLRRFAEHGGAPRALGALQEIAERSAAAVAAGDRAGFLAAIVATPPVLRALGAEVGLALVTPGLERLMAAAARVGAAAKPSGAGGGDCGIAFAPSPAVAAAVRSAWQEQGILPLDVSIAAEGVVVG